MLLIDSANISEVERALKLGFVRGCTTNPILLSKVPDAPEAVIERLCQIVPGPVFYQLTGRTEAEKEQEARKFYQIAPDKIVLKIPATTENLALVTRLTPEIPCAATAVFSGYQTLLAIEAGCSYIIPYVNRATRLLGDGIKLVAELAAVIQATGKPVELVAASVKSPEEAVRAFIAGAHHLTLPLEVLLALGNHPLSDEAIAEFQKAVDSR
ncbi:transaldolase [candidate division WOR-3 bacterium]|nr:transaldolase [candidate division WOR-3 bacterium]